IDPVTTSALRLLNRAVGSAMRIVGTDDPASGFASDFLGGLIHAGAATQDAVSEPHDPQGESVDEQTQDEYPGPVSTQGEEPVGARPAAGEESAGSVGGASAVVAGGDLPSEAEMAFWADRQAALDEYLDLSVGSESAPFDDGFDEVGFENDPSDPEANEGVGNDLRPDRTQPTGGSLSWADSAVAGNTATSEVAQGELARIEAILEQPGNKLTRAGLYNQLAIERFPELSPADQIEVLRAFDTYADTLNSMDGYVLSGLAPGSLEARRADLAMKIAADFARQAGTIPSEAGFGADARAGMNVGMAMMINGIVGRDRLGVGSPGRRIIEVADFQPSAGSSPSRPLPSAAAPQTREIIDLLATGPRDEVIIGSGRALGARLPQDVEVSPVSPQRLDLEDRVVGKSPTQNAVMRADVAMLERMGVREIRINQQHINGNNVRVGINKPDVQGTLPDGRRIVIEYDTDKSNRGAAHAARALNNDPSIIVILKRVN
ncbi:hypothetical protein ACFSF0_03095, partial [Ottowia flava]